MPSLIQSPVVGPYEIQEEWSRDAFGTTYIGIHQKKRSAPSLIRIISPEICNRENFIVRFDLLKTILPTLNHPNLLKVEEMGVEQNMYYVGKEFPGKIAQPIKTFVDLPLQDIPQRFLTFAKILNGIANGLDFLKKLSLSYYRNGIDFINFSPDLIYLVPSEASPFNWDRTVKMDGYADVFLFFGDTKESLFTYHFQKSSSKKSGNNLFADYITSPHASKPDGHIGNAEVQAALGALIYHKLTHRLPSSPLKPLKELDPLCPEKIEEICVKCLQAPFGKGYDKFSDLSRELEAFIRMQERPSAKDKLLQEMSPPENMSLVALQEKALLGASDGPENEHPLFKATIRPFFIDRNPITNAKYQKFNPKYQRSTYSKNDDSPATLINLAEAQAYCHYRSKAEGLPVGTYRLPTEYEWEACVRGSTGDHYPWGPSLEDDMMHCGRPPAEGTTSVYAHPAGRFFLYSMLGNVWEWTSSTYQPHPFSKYEDPKYQSKLSVVKGGCWFTPMDKCRASLRAAFPHFIRKGNIGFRCVRSLPDNFQG